MNMPLVLAAVCAGLPGCTIQDPDMPTGPDTAAFAAACREDNAQEVTQDNAQRASSALPARASTGPAPHLGTVAPSTRLPSHVVTPSMRAMEKANAAREAQEADNAKKNSRPCGPAVEPGPAPPGGASKG